MTHYIERTANVAIAVAALGLLLIYGKREWASTGARRESSMPAAAIYYDGWSALDSASLPLDSSDGPLRVYVFSDLECPFCATFHLAIVPSLYRRYANAVSINLVHFPLKGHRFASQAAAALECADDQRRTSQFLDATYTKQDSIGLLEWAAIAKAAGVNDSLAFRQCMRRPLPDRVKFGQSIGARFDVSSTPTIIVNGWRFSGLPDSASFLSAMDSILNGGAPLVSASSPDR